MEASAGAADPIGAAFIIGLAAWSLFVPQGAARGERKQDAGDTWEQGAGNSFDGGHYKKGDMKSKGGYWVFVHEGAMMIGRCKQ